MNKFLSLSDLHKSGANLVIFFRICVKKMTSFDMICPKSSLLPQMPDQAVLPECLQRLLSRSP